MLVMEIATHLVNRLAWLHDIVGDSWKAISYAMATTSTIITLHHLCIRAGTRTSCCNVCRLFAMVALLGFVVKLQV